MMGKILEKLSPTYLVLLTLLIKLPIFFAEHIQEDSFITWKVAKNLVEYGVIGFNGEERLSASTTHLYVLVSAFFQLILGDFFVYPLLIFNAILFAIGSYWFGKCLFPNHIYKRNIFVILLNCMPPAITASCLGMEYGILFFLYSGLLYHGFVNRKSWAFFLFPILLIWTRLDAVIFLGIVFLFDLIKTKKLNYSFIGGGLVAAISVSLFNYFYFGEFVNNTISAKKTAYEDFLNNDSLQFLIYQFSYYGGLIKLYGPYSTFVFFAFLLFLGFVIRKIITSKGIFTEKTKYVVMVFLVFALTKISVFAYFKAYFDWYYWLPRTFLFAIVIFWILIYHWKSKLSKFLVVCAVVGLYAFQLLQSLAIGYMETTQRVQIAKDLLEYKPTIKQSILLEPAGKIPFYTGLYTYDEVGLVNSEVMEEMIADKKFWWMNSVKKLEPTFILTISEKADSQKMYYQMREGEKEYFFEHYEFVKTYPISDIHKYAPFYVKWVYGVRAIGKDYHLYRRK